MKMGSFRVQTLPEQFGFTVPGGHAHSYEPMMFMHT